MKQNLKNLQFIINFLTLTTLFAATLTVESSTGDFFPRISKNCISERRDVSKFYLFKAKSAPIVIRATVNDSHIDQNQGSLLSFKVGGVKFYKGAHLITQQDKTVLASIFSQKGFLYVNLQKSVCPEMRVFNNYKDKTEYIFYLSKSSEPDEILVVKEATVNVPTLTMFAQPDVYKPKIDRNLRNNLFCRTCIKVAPYFSNRHVNKIYNAIEGKSFTLDCKARGFPLPHNYITSNGTDIMTIIMQQRLGDRYSLNTKGRKIQLVIKDVRPADESLFRCVGTDFYSDDAISETLLTVSAKIEASKETELGISGSSTPELNWTTAAPKTGQQCPEYYQGYCQNGASCYWIPEDDIIGCICPPYYYGRRCQDYVPFGKLYQIKKENPRFWTIFTFIILASCLIVALMVMAKQYWKIKTMKRRARDQSLNSPTFAFDYEVEPVPKRFSAVREVSFTALDKFERLHCGQPNSSMDRLCIPLRTYPMEDNKTPVKMTPKPTHLDLSGWNPSNHQSHTLPSPKKFSTYNFPHNGDLSDRRPLTSSPKKVESQGQPERDSFVPKVPHNFAELNHNCKETDIVGSDESSIESSAAVSDYASTRTNEYVLPSSPIRDYPHVL